MTSKYAYTALSTKTECTLASLKQHAPADKLEHLLVRAMCLSVYACVFACVCVCARVLFSDLCVVLVLTFMHNLGDRLARRPCSEPAPLYCEAHVRTDACCIAHNA